MADYVMVDMVAEAATGQRTPEEAARRAEQRGHERGEGGAGSKLDGGQAADVEGGGGEGHSLRRRRR